jgi:hypothetical protein
MFHEAILSMGVCGWFRAQNEGGPIAFSDRASSGALKGAHFRRQGMPGVTITALDPSAGGTTPSRGMSSDR